jgi:F-type H+-transporting ATPase subunit b
VKALIFPSVLALGLFLAPLAALADEAPAHGHAEQGEQAEHGEQAEGHDAKAHHGGHHAIPTFKDINWTQGFFFESDSMEPGFVARPKGTPPPLGAMILNTLILFGVIYRFGSKALSDGLKKRRDGVMRGIEEASKMRKDAERQLSDYEDKLEHIEEEIERVRREMREAGEAERQRAVAEAKERGERMERDAKLLVEQELKAASDLLMRETIAAALRSAESVIQRDLKPEDHDRFATEYLDAIRQSAGTLRGRT